MKNEYHHLSLGEREQLSVLRNQGKTFREIGEIIDRNHSSLSREYRKNSRYYRKYQPHLAQEKADKLTIKQRTKAPLKNKEIFLYVRQHLRMGWSPEIIAGRLSVDHPEFSIDDDTIYRYIYNPKKTRGDYLWKYLTHHRKKRRKINGRKIKTERLKNYLSIDQRSNDINDRKYLGHWETDNMEGKKSDQNILSATVERKSRFTILTKLDNRKAITKSKAIINRLNDLPKGLTQSITSDRGTENYDYKSISEKLNIPFYFCNAYHPWEKGTVENTIGRIRRFLPKGNSLDDISNDYIKKLEHYLNSVPRKCLNFLTPYETIRQLQIK